MDFSCFPLVKRPSRYLGSELHAIRPPLIRDNLHVGLAFPDLYEIGMSHVGLSLLYHCLNLESRISAERVFLPDVDLQDLLRDRDIPLCTLETRTPLSKLDVLGFTLAYELTYTNVLAILDLGKIPLRSTDRTRNHPIVVAGGPCAFNPEPLSAFIDAFVIGDGELRLPEICHLISEWKAAGETRDSLLKALNRQEGVYVPSLFSWRHDPSSRAWSMAPPTDRTGPVRKCTVSDLDTTPYPDKPIVPFARIVHDRISIEASRGCPHGCRFCQASVIYRPYRERSPERILDLALASVENTGHGDLSLLALSIGDYSKLRPLASSLMTGLLPCRVALSLPSVRVGSLDPLVVEEVLRVRKTGVTLAPEAATTRLRDIINKGIEEEELFRTASLLARRGWRALKLYFMIGLPLEEDNDVEGIVRLSEEIQASAKRARSGPFQVTVNVSTFVPKAHTPFQWETQMSRARAEEKQEFLKKRLRGPGIRLKWHDARLSLLEGIFARGDRRACDLLEAAYRLGCRMDGWSEHLRFDLWEKAFASKSAALDQYLAPFPSPEGPLPWDWIDAGVSKAFLVRERRRAHECTKTPFRCKGNCDRCGLCTLQSENTSPLTDGRVEPVQECAEAYRPESLSDPATMSTSMVEGRRRMGAGQRATTQRIEPAERIRVNYWKRGLGSLLSHLETITVLYRAFRRSGLPVSYTVGEHPQPRVSFSPALPLGVESCAETVDLWFDEPVSPEIVRDRLNGTLPDGLRVVCAFRVPLPSPSPEASIRWIEYEISFPGKDLDPADQGALREAREALCARYGDPGDDRTILKEPPDGQPGSAPRVEILGEGKCLGLRIWKTAGSLPSPYRVLQEAFPDADPRSMALNIRKTRTSLAGAFSEDSMDPPYTQGTTTWQTN